MDNCWEAAVSIFAILKAGATFSPINPSTKADKLAYVIGNCRGTAILTTGKLMPVVEEARQDLSSPLTVIATAVESGALPAGAVAFEDCLALAPIPVRHKGIDVDLAMLDLHLRLHGAAEGRDDDAQQYRGRRDLDHDLCENTPDDIILNVLPIAFDYGLYQLLMSLKMGATLVLEKSFAFPQSIFDRIRAEGVTGLPLVPTMAAMILQMRDVEPGFLPSVHYLTNTAAALPRESHCALAPAVPRSAALFDVWADRVQALHLFAPG